MNNALDPISLATLSQQSVANPKISAWVDASAGSGKTKVLTDRVLRLMLAHQAPEKILCLTFTKAASAEMTNRVTSRLAGWSTAEDQTILEQLRAIGETDSSEKMIKRARTLFARVIDAPGGLKVQTVHSFCQSALERFPAEAGVPPGFHTLDERTANNLLREARDYTLRSIMAGNQTTLIAQALDQLVIRGEAETLDNLLQAFLSERARIGELGGWDNALKASLSFFGFAEEAEAVTSASLGSIPPQIERNLHRIGEALTGGGKTDEARASEINEWLSLPIEERSEATKLIFSAFFTGAGEESPRSKPATKNVLSAHPWFADVYSEASEFFFNARERMRLAERALETAAALRVSGAVADRYDLMKLARSALDFDDLILSTRDLLQKNGGAQWAALKLDQGIDHILVDEAQDTNPEQWQVVRALADEFFQADTNPERTFFAVGDPKQSIFSFQRADPRAFGEVREHYEAMAKESGRNFESRPMPVSFRSVPAVLRVVDATFSGHTSSRVTLDNSSIQHFAARGALPGQVELWPPVPSLEVETTDPWIPLKSYPEVVSSPVTQLAAVVAGEIKRLIDDPNIHLPERPGQEQRGQKTRIKASDIMIVLQQRRPFGDAITKALKELGVATSGLDRMRLADQLVVQDILNVARVALLPEDDLALACILKSPLVGFTEEDLFRLAHNRGHLSLWQQLKREASKGETLASKAWSFVANALARADTNSPFDFFHWVLGPMNGRARLIAAMGDGVIDPIQEFLSLAIQYSEEIGPDLTGFIAWIERDATEIKRELEGIGNSVRIMTAHAAKGLQAPIVFLPDAIRAPAQDRVRLYWTRNQGLAVPILGATSAKKNPSIIQTLVDEQVNLQAEERRRLLYVAMTRAEDRLYVMGWNNRKSAPTETWHELVKTGMTTNFTELEKRRVDYSDEPILIYREGEEEKLEIHAPEKKTEAITQLPLPNWAVTPITAINPDIIYAPSGHIVDEQEETRAGISPLATQDRSSSQNSRFGRGLLIHKLLERLPNLTLSQREPAGKLFLRRSGRFNDDEANTILRRVLSIIEDPTFGAVFHADALAETPIAGFINGMRFAGVIDRLIVTEDLVQIVDFKTNRPPPLDPETTPKEYLKQMAIYRELAKQAFSGKEILTGILWTEAPRLDVLKDNQLDAFTPQNTAVD